MMMRLLGVLVVTGLVAACSSGVMQLGPDTYRVSIEGMSLTGSEAEAIAAANRHCTAMGRQVDVLAMKSTPYSMASYANATVNFKCVAAKGNQAP